jgi:hypothetical protein
MLGNLELPESLLELEQDLLHNCWFACDFQVIDMLCNETDKLAIGVRET